MGAPLVTPESATITEARNLQPGHDHLPVADPHNHGMHWRRLTHAIELPDNQLALACEGDDPTRTTVPRDAQIIIRRRDLNDDA